MSYNGYKNFETWLFMLYFEHDIYGILKERHENEEITYSAVYETVKHIIEEIRNDTDKIEYGYPFVKDILDASLREINIKEVTDHLIRDLNDEN